MPALRLTSTCLARSTARCWDRFACSSLSRSISVPGGQLAVAQRLDDGDAGGVGQGLEDLGLELPKRVLHVDKYIRLINVLAGHDWDVGRAGLFHPQADGRIDSQGAACWYPGRGQRHCEQAEDG